MAPSSSLPTLVLLHGAWLLPDSFDPILPGLKSAGYDVVVPKLPHSVTDAKIGPQPLSADIKVIHDTVTEVLDGKDGQPGRNALLVLHSFGGLPGGSALDGLDREAREAEGKSTYVTRLVYVSAHLVVEGTGLNPRGTADNMVPAMKPDFQKGIVTVDPAGTRELMFQDVTDEKLAELNAKLVPQSLEANWSKTTSAAWRVIPTTYVRCMKDYPSTVAATQWLIDTARASGQCAIDKVIEHEVGHSPQFSQPDWMVEMIRKEAGESF